MNERVHGALVQLGCYQYSPCGKVHDCTMKMRRLPQIIRTFPHTISTNTVKKFYTAALCDMQRRFAGVQLSHTSSGKVLQCSDDALYSVPTAESVRLCSEVCLCSQSYKWTLSSEVNIPQHAHYFYPRSALWCDKHACAC